MRRGQVGRKRGGGNAEQEDTKKEKQGDAERRWEKEVFSKHSGAH